MTSIHYNKFLITAITIPITLVIINFLHKKINSTATNNTTNNATSNTVQFIAIMVVIFVMKS